MGKWIGLDIFIIFNYNKRFPAMHHTNPILVIFNATNTKIKNKNSLFVYVSFFQHEKVEKTFVGT